jgi:hypothetical protein
MFKSIQNVGEFEGGKAMMHPCGCALTPVLSWPVRTPIKHTVTGRKTAVRLSKVVTRVVTDWKSGWKPKHTGVSETNFIGEQNRRSIKTIILLPSAAFDGGSKKGPGGGCKKATLSPPYPRVHSIGSAQKYFLDFHP